MKSDHIVEALTGDSGWRNMVPQVDSSDFPTQWVPSAYECSIIEAQAKEIEKLRAQASTVVHGWWNADETCSVCGEKSTEGLDATKWNYWFPNYCPNCGAKMDEGDNNTCL